VRGAAKNLIKNKSVTDRREKKRARPSGSSTPYARRARRNPRQDECNEDYRGGHLVKGGSLPVLPKSRGEKV